MFGHDSQVPAPGDFYTAQDRTVRPVIMVRGRRFKGAWYLPNRWLTQGARSWSAGEPHGKGARAWGVLPLAPIIGLDISPWDGKRLRSVPFEEAVITGHSFRRAPTRCNGTARNQTHSTYRGFVLFARMAAEGPWIFQGISLATR